MVPITRLRRTKRTVGVNQLFMEAQIEGTDMDSSSMVLRHRGTQQRERDREKERKERVALLCRDVEREKGNTEETQRGGDLDFYLFVWVKIFINKKYFFLIFY